MQKVEQTILSQYANSPALLALINEFNSAVDPSPELNSFYDNVWNIATAVGWGLDNWGRIVGVSRTVPVPVPLSGFLGFSQQPQSASFGHGVFYLMPNSSANYNLLDGAYRELILTKAFSNISNCAIPTFNKMLMQLFPGRGNAYVIDQGNMHMILMFEFLLQPYELSILKYSGAFSNPTGVLSQIYQYNRGHVFGFSQQPGSNGFGHGTFFKGFQ